MLLLDCTLRDGGYLNNWEFSPEFGRSIYRELSAAGVDIIELGFLYNDGGYFKSLTPDKVSYLTQDTDASEACVMIDYGKCDYNLPPKNKTNISMIRIAVHKHYLYHAFDLCKRIADDGYKTSVQMMNFPSYRREEVVDALEKACDLKIDYLYVADSFGSMYSYQVYDPIALMNAYGIGSGFHPHNNLHLAYANSLAAIEAKVSILDGTLLGVGRGAGNLSLEQIMLYLELKNNNSYNMTRVFDLIEDYKIEFESCGYKSKCEYIISGLLNVHPNKVEELRESGLRYSNIWKQLRI